MDSMESLLCKLKIDAFYATSMHIRVQSNRCKCNRKHTLLASMHTIKRHCVNNLLSARNNLCFTLMQGTVKLVRACSHDQVGGLQVSSL